jgi:hypothetical protein
MVSSLKISAGLFHLCVHQIWLKLSNAEIKRAKKPRCNFAEPAACTNTMSRALADILLP